MNLGIRDAIALSDALARSIKQNDDTALSKYARERREKAMEVLRMTDRLMQVATSGNRGTRWFRNRIIAVLAKLPFVRRAVARRLAGYA